MIQEVAPDSVDVSDLVSRALALYRSEPFTVRAYLQLRRRLLPLASLDADLPREGRILDLACGYGLVANLLALGSAQRDVLGIDLDPARVATAAAAGRDLRNVRFETGDLTQLEREGHRGVVLLDTLHYFPADRQRDLLGRCRSALVAGGTLVLRDAVREATLRFAWSYAHEAVMVRTALTATRERLLHFRSREELLGLVEEAGFSVRRVDAPAWHLPYADTLVVAEARAAWQ